MAMQLAYYRLHKKFVLTYESATTRLYYQGRTETIRPVSDDSVAFVKAMDDPGASKEEARESLKRAIKYVFEERGKIIIIIQWTPSNPATLGTCQSV